MLNKIKVTLLTALTFATITSVNAQPQLDSIKVNLVTVSQERLFDGVVEAINKSTVSAQTAGRVIEINFDIDDRVEKDAVLIKISDSEQSASATQAAGSVSRAKAKLILAKNNLERFEKLFESQTVSKSQLDDAKSAFDSAKASLRTARAGRDSAQKQVEYTTVRAPYSGIVTARLVELGEAVSPGQPLMAGLSLTQLRVETNVPSRFAQSIHAENGVDIIIDTQPPTKIQASGITVFPFANVQSNSVTVRVEIPQEAQGLYPGMLTKIAFRTGESERIMVPVSAVMSRSEVTGVYVLKDERIYLRHVRIGNTRLNNQNQQVVEVLSGLKVGETVAVDAVAAVQQLISQRATSSVDKKEH